MITKNTSVPIFTTITSKLPRGLVTSLFNPHVEYAVTTMFMTQMIHTHIETTTYSSTPIELFVNQLLTDLIDEVMNRPETDQ